MTIPFWVGGLLLLSGCASLRDYHYEYTQHSRARSQYREAGNPSCSKYPKDYKKGWLDGFYEVTTGGSSCPPAIAPACYWKPGQILDDCDNRRHEYYSGWQDGAARASQFPDTHYLRIYETCECPFPRCNCGGCGQTPCSCTGGNCTTCQQDVGMVYHSGTIEADREIMMVPIPSAGEVHDADTEELPPARNDAAAMDPNSNPPSEPTLPVPPVVESQSVSEPSKGSEPGTVSLPVPVMESAEAAEPAEPISPSDPILGEGAAAEQGPQSGAGTEAAPQPIAPTPQPESSDAKENAFKSQSSDSDPTVRYQFSDDNSVTIDFGPSGSTVSAGASILLDPETTILSDFDVQLDDGLIE